MCRAASLAPGCTSSCCRTASAIARGRGRRPKACSSSTGSGAARRVRSGIPRRGLVPAARRRAAPGAVPRRRAPIALASRTLSSTTTCRSSAPRGATHAFAAGPSASLEAYLLDWLTLLARWAHIVVGIAWIGASFYFIWLDNHLEASKSGEFSGELYAIHGGGFYRAQKYKLAPPELPPTLHWFKWEAYWTWITGFTMLVLVYYLNPQLYLIDASVRELSPGAAIGIGLGSLVVGLVVYEAVVPLTPGERAVLAIALLVLFGVRRLGPDPGVQRPRRVHPLRRDPRHDHGGERRARHHSRAARAGACQAGRARARSEIRPRRQATQRAQHLLHAAGDLHHDLRPPRDDLRPRAGTGWC